MKLNNQVVIIGAGISGLACALSLKRLGIPFLILEASDKVGGRIRTDKFEGFLLDRGFQVLLTDYPEAKRMLDYTALELKEFRSGSIIRHKGKFRRFFDPFREPSQIFSTMFSSIGTLADKIKIAKLKMSLAFTDSEHILSQPETSTIQALKAYGFSNEIIESFFKPFFGGVFLDLNLANSSRLFNWLFKLFSSGAVAIPKLGMEEIPKQLAKNIGKENIRFNCTVSSVSANSVVLESGESLSASHIVLATNIGAARKIIDNLPINVAEQSVTCLYFAADDAPISEPVLILNGEGAGPINNLCFLSNISTNYAPAGKSLLSVSVIDEAWQKDEGLEQAVKLQLDDWFGIKSKDWQHLKTYKIYSAVPKQVPPTNFSNTEYRLPTGQYFCGDYANTPSINGALKSGREVAELISEST